MSMSCWCQFTYLPTKRIKKTGTKLGDLDQGFSFQFLTIGHLHRNITIYNLLNMVASQTRSPNCWGAGMHLGGIRRDVSLLQTNNVSANHTLGAWERECVLVVRAILCFMIVLFLLKKMLYLNKYLHGDCTFVRIRTFHLGCDQWDNSLAHGEKAVEVAECRNQKKIQEAALCKDPQTDMQVCIINLVKDRFLHLTSP